MIKLVDLLKEDKGEKYPPYMFSKDGFGCHVCEYYYLKDNKHYCRNEEYENYMGTNELVDKYGNQIENPSQWCSNWFHPKNK